MKLRSFSEHLRAKAQATADIGDATDFTEAAAKLDLYEAALRELEKKATATLAAMDRYNDENSTYIIGPSLLQLGSAVAVARKALNSTDTGA